MHRVDTPTAQKDKFGAGKNGFTRGNPQTGTPATDLDDDYCDSIQEELAGIVEASGAALDKSKRNQVLTAIKALLLSREHPFADIKADGAAAVAEALSNLGLGTAAKKDVGTGAGQVPDMSSFAATPTSQLLPGGKKFLWGDGVYQGSAGAAGSVINFPTPFPSAAYIVLIIDVGGGVNRVSATPISRTQFRCWGKDASDTFNTTNFKYLVIGE